MVGWRDTTLRVVGCSCAVSWRGWLGSMVAVRTPRVRGGVVVGLTLGHGERPRTCAPMNTVCILVWCSGCVLHSYGCACRVGVYALSSLHPCESFLLTCWCITGVHCHMGGVHPILCVHLTG